MGYMARNVWTCYMLRIYLFISWDTGSRSVKTLLLAWFLIVTRSLFTDEFFPWCSIVDFEFSFSSSVSCCFVDTGIRCGQFLDGKYGTSFIIPTSRYITKLHGEIPRRKFHANVLRSLLGSEICLPWQCQYRGCQCCCNENKSISWCTDGSP